MGRTVGPLCIAAALAGTPTAAADRVSFQTNWLAQAEHGGFYQAVVDGTYARHGLDVVVRPGGPQTNGMLLLSSGRVDFAMAGDMIEAFSAVEQGVPILAVAAVMQKDPQVLLSHPGVGLDTFQALRAAPIYVSRDGLASFYRWMEAAHGFTEDKVKAYTFDSAPFVADRSSVEQGYLTAEPYEVERRGGFKPNVFLLADYGFSSYATLIMARADTVRDRPDLVQRFVDASMIGWQHYLHGDRAAADAAIAADNPDMTDAEIAFSVDAMKARGIVDSGDAEHLGLGAMTDERQRDFFDKMAAAGVVPSSLDYRRAYTLRFVGQGGGTAAPATP